MSKYRDNGTEKYEVGEVEFHINNILFTIRS